MASALISLCPTFSPHLSSPKPQQKLTTRLSNPSPSSQKHRNPLNFQTSALGGDLLGDFGARDPFPAEIESNFGEKVVGCAGTEHKILIPNLAAISLAQRSCEPISASQAPMQIKDAEKLLKKDCGAGVEMIVQITPEKSGRLRVRAMGVCTFRRQMRSNTYELGILRDMSTIHVFYVEDLVPYPVLEKYHAMHPVLPFAPVVGYLAVATTVPPMSLPFVLPPAPTQFEQRHDLPEVDFSEMEPDAEQIDDEMTSLHPCLILCTGQLESGMLQIAVFYYLVRWKGHPDGRLTFEEDPEVAMLHYHLIQQEVNFSNSGRLMEI